MSDNQVQNPGGMSSIGYLFSQSWVIYKKKFWQLIGMSLLPGLVGFVGGFLAAIIAIVVGLTGNAKAVYITLIIVFGLLAIAGFLFLVFLSVSASAATYILVRDNEKDVSLKNAFMEGARYFWRFLIISLLLGIIIMLWTLLFIIPGIIFGLYYSFAAWVLINEQKEDMSALRRSKELVKKHWWAVFGRLFILLLPIYLIMFVPMIGQSKEFVESWNNIISLLSIIIGPFALIYSWLIYKDLVRIKDGVASNNPMVADNVSVGENN